jgi:cytochrome bd-type quinol oxidase subunit 2
LNSSQRYSLEAERVAYTLGAVMAVLVVVHVLAMQANFNPALGLKERFGFHYWQLAFFDLDEEESFGTWFSSGILLMAAVLLAHQARILRAEGESWHKWWLVLAIGFCFMSVDEVAGMHEYMNTMMEETPWTVVGFPILLLVALAYLPFLWHHRGRTGLLFLLAGAVYGGGAVGVEHFTDADVNSLHYNMWTALEEGMEMAGVIVFIYALLDHIRGTPERVVRLEVGLDDATTRSV